jgi:Pol polyprotein, beta-barrel domain
LEAHEADLSAVEVSTQAATAFIAQGRPARRFNNLPFNRTSNFQQNPISSNRQGMQVNGPSPRPFFRCNNCGKIGHSAAGGTAPGGGLSRQDAWRREEPWRTDAWRRESNGQSGSANQQSSQPERTNGNTPNSVAGAARFANTTTREIVMMVKITEIVEPESTKITLSTHTSALSAIQDRAHMWLIDSAATSHICGELDLFEEIHPISSISVETASGDSFIANQRGTTHFIIQSDTHMSLQPVALTLQNVIFVPKLDANLLSVRRMTSGDIDLVFSKTNTSLLLDGEIIARGRKINILFAYMALSPLQVTKEAANYYG